MVTTTIRQTVTFHATPSQVFDVLMDARKHQGLSGRPAHISKKVGAKFTTRGARVRGYNLVVKRGKKIVQAWRAKGWPTDHYSIATFDFAKVRGGTRLHFTQLGVPHDRHSGHYREWIEGYWMPIKEMLASDEGSGRKRKRVRTNKVHLIQRRRLRQGRARERSSY